MTTSHNPFTPRLKKKLAILSKIEAQQNAPSVPGTYITGNSGVSPARRRKLDRQLDRTIDLSVSWVQLQRDIKYLRVSERLYDAGKCSANGQPIREKKPKRKYKVNPHTSIIRAGLTSLSIDGAFTLPTGHKLEVLLYWCELERELIGIIRVTDGPIVINYKTASPQGVDLEAMQGYILKNILKES